MEMTPAELLKENQRKYREANKEKIAERAKEKKYWKTYYEKNKEKIRVKNLEKYYEKVGLVKKEEPAVIDEKILKLEGLLKDLKEFVPVIGKTSFRKSSE
jgi:hypothetical protein